MRNVDTVDRCGARACVAGCVQTVRNVAVCFGSSVSSLSSCDCASKSCMCESVVSEQENRSLVFGKDCERSVLVCRGLVSSRAKESRGHSPLDAPLPKKEW